MKRAGALELLDRSVDLIRRMPLATALLWLTALPARLLLARFALVLIELGTGAASHVHALRRISIAYLCAFFVSLYGRQLFVSAFLARSAQEETPEPRLRELLRVPLPRIASHIYAAAAIELLFWLTLPTYFLPAFSVAAGAVAAATASANLSGLAAPLTQTVKAWSAGWSLCKISFVALCALAIAFANLYALGGAVAWLVSELVGLDLAAVSEVISPANPLVVALVAAGASILVEPFYLGMVALQVDAGRSLQTGDDLRRRFAELLRSRAA